MMIRMLTPSSLLAVLLLCACGDAGTPALKPSIDGTPTGYFSIEEHAGKRVFDAWFSSGDSASPSENTLWQADEQRCARVSLPASADEQSTAVGSRWRDTVYAGDFLAVQARGQEVIRLVAQTLGSSTLYAPEQRWLPTELPEDSLLMIAGSEQFPAFEPVPLLPLTPLVMIAPLTGVMTNPSEPVRWEPSADHSDVIDLWISSSDVDNASTRDIRCRLEDSGSFELPQAVRDALTSQTPWVIRMSRRRDAQHEYQGARLLVSQRSYP